MSKDMFCEMADAVLQDTNTKDIDEINAAIEYLYGMRFVLLAYNNCDAASYVSNIINTMYKIKHDMLDI